MPPGVGGGCNVGAPGSQSTPQVGIGPTGNGSFGPTVSLDRRAPNLTAAYQASETAGRGERDDGRITRNV